LPPDRPLTHAHLNLALTETQLIVQPILRPTQLAPLALPCPPGAPVVLLPHGAPAFALGPYAGPIGTLNTDFGAALAGRGAGRGPWTRGDTAASSSRGAEYVLLWLPVASGDSGEAQAAGAADADAHGLVAVWPAALCLVHVPGRAPLAPLPALPMHLAASPPPAACAGPAYAPRKRPRLRRAHTAPGARGLRDNAGRTASPLGALAASVSTYVGAVARERDRERERLRRARADAAAAATAAGFVNTPASAVDSQMATPTDSALPGSSPMRTPARAPAVDLAFSPPVEEYDSLFSPAADNNDDDDDDDDDEGASLFSPAASPVPSPPPPPAPPPARALTVPVPMLALPADPFTLALPGGTGAFGTGLGAWPTPEDMAVDDEGVFGLDLNVHSDDMEADDMFARDLALAMAGGDTPSAEADGMLVDDMLHSTPRADDDVAPLTPVTVPSALSVAAEPEPSPAPSPARSLASTAVPPPAPALAPSLLALAQRSMSSPSAASSANAFDPIAFAPAHAAADGKYAAGGKFAAWADAPGPPAPAPPALAPYTPSPYAAATDPRVRIAARLAAARSMSVGPPARAADARTAAWVRETEDWRAPVADAEDDGGASSSSDDEEVAPARATTPPPPDLPPGAALLATAFAPACLAPLAGPLRAAPRPSHAPSPAGPPGPGAPTPLSPAALLGAASEQAAHAQAAAQVLALEVAANPLWAAEFAPAREDAGAHPADVRAVQGALPALSGLEPLQPRALLEPGDGEEQTLTRLEEPHIYVGKAGTVLSLLPSALPFWEKLGLQPRGGQKDVVAYAVVDEGIVSAHAAAAWVRALGAVYAVSVEGGVLGPFVD
jgi:mediator of RNA polymerase II transcription subunit 13